MRLIVSNYDYLGLVQGLRDLGHEVFAGDERNWWDACWPKGGGRPRSPSAFGRGLMADINRLGKIDAVIIGKGWDSNQPVPDCQPSFWHILSNDVHMLRDYGIAVVVLDFDAPDSFGFFTNCGLAEACNAILSCSIEVKDHMKRYTKAEVTEFWPGWDQVLRDKVVVQEEDRCDFLMIGSPYVKPNDSFGMARRDIIRAALDVTDRVQIWGPDHWIKNQDDFGGDPAFERYYRGSCPWDELHHKFGAARITYNSFLRRSFRYVNDRIFLAGGAGTFLLMEEQPGLELEFKHVGWHRRGDVKSFQSQLRYWLDHEEERAVKAEAMKVQIRTEHSYAVRAQQLAQVCERHARFAKERKNAGCCGKAQLA